MALAVIEGGKTENFEKGSKAWADHIRKETKELVHNIEHQYLRLAQNLWLIFDIPVDGDPKNTCWLTKWGYGHIGEYAEKELGIDKRIADRLRRMWKVIGLDCKDSIDDEWRNRFIGIGRSKARLITRPFVMDNSNSHSWIEKAEKLTFLELEEEVDAYLAGRAGVMKGTLGKVEATDADGDVVEDIDEDESDAKPSVHTKTVEQMVGDSVQEQISKGSGFKDDKEDKEDKPKHYKTFAFYDDQWDTVKAALERSQELSGSKVDSHNLSLICLDFLATNEFKKASMEQTQRFIKRLEKALSVKLIALTPKDFEVLYGYKTLNRLIDQK